MRPLGGPWSGPGKGAFGMTQNNLDSFGARSTLTVGDRSYEIFRLDALKTAGVGHVDSLPFSLRVLVENLLRHEDGVAVTRDDIEAAADWDAKAEPSVEIAYHPARVLLQDFTGVPAVVDLAAMREAMKAMGGTFSQPGLAGRVAVT